MNILDELHTQGGFTHTALATQCDCPTTGYAVAVGNGANEHTVDLEQLTAEHITEYVEAHDDILTTRTIRLGAWVDAGQVYLDCSEIVPDLDTALRLGTERGEKAIWGFAEGREFRCDEGH